MEDPVTPIERLHCVLGDAAYIFSALLPGSTDNRDYDAAVRRAEDALVAAEAETEVHEAAVACGHHQPPSNRWVGYWCSLNRGHEGHHSAEVDGETLATWADPQMDWRGWSVPAIIEVLAEHRLGGNINRPGSYCRELDGSLHGNYGDIADWAEHVANLIADRIACDPQRAIEALTHDTMSR